MSNARTEVGYFKTPPLVKQELERIAGETRRTVSTVTYYLLLRGLEAYHRDGELFGEEDELAFLREDAKPNRPRQRRTSR